MRYLFLIAALLWAAIPFWGQSRNRLAGDSIRSVDFYNFEYEPGCLGYKTPVRTKKGQFSSTDPATGPVRFKVVQIAYGDLDGDGRDEAVVVTSCDTGGSGAVTEGHIFTLRESKAVQIVRLEKGSGADGGIAGIKIEQNILHVSRNRGKAMCCPEEIETTPFRLDGARLVQVGEVERRKIEEK